MPRHDWRALYAANQAAIAASRGAAPAAPAPPAPPAFHLPASTGRLPAIDLSRLAGADLSNLPGTGPATVPTGAGTLERRAVTTPGGRRSFFVYTPAGHTGTTLPLVVALHGCTQTAAGFAASSGLHPVADRDGFVVAYPEQSAEHNPGSCWNWFLPAHQTRGAGEPAALAAVTRSLLTAGGEVTVDPARVYVTGLSSGGAMAAVMGVTYPDLFAAVGICAGLPYRAATSQQAAFAVMSGGAGDPAALGRAAFEAMGGRARVVPVAVVHGTADRTVDPANGEAVVRQFQTAARLAAPGRVTPAFDQPSHVGSGEVPGGLRWATSSWHDDRGAEVQRYVQVLGLGHAWTGGAGGSFTEPRGPSASELMAAFFARHRLP